MRRNDYILFGDIDTRSYSVGIFGDQLANAPERDLEYVSVPGRDGDLILDNGRYKNISVKYKAYIIDKYNSNIRGLRNALVSKVGYQRLEDTVNPEEFRLAQAIPFDIDEYGILRAGEFVMEFNCKPQRFLKSGEQPIEITASTSLFNEHMPSKPLVRAYGTGTFTINGVVVTITTANSYTDIDCELQECYKDTLATNCNGNVTLTSGNFPTLATGENSVSMSGITKLVITPRWWML